MKKIINKAIIFVFSIMFVVVINVAFAVDTTEQEVTNGEADDSTLETDAPTISVNKPSNSKVNPGDRIIVTIKDESGLKDIKYNWNDKDEVEPLKDEDKTYRKYEIEMGKFPKLNNTYVLKISATDIHGNFTGVKEYTYKIEYTDDTAPKITMSEPTGSVLEPGTKLTMIVEDLESKVTSLKYNWVNSSVKEVIPNEEVPANKCTIYIPKIGSLPGTYKFTVTAVNSAGEKITETFTYYVKDKNNTDNEKPTVSATPKSGSTVNAKETIELLLKDNKELKSLTYIWNDEKVTEKSISGKSYTVKATTPDEEGTHKLKVIVVDKANNSAVETFNYTIKKEVNPKMPTISMEPEGGSTVAGGKVIKATLKDDVGLKKVTYNWEDDDTETKTLSGTSKTIDLPEAPKEEGTYKIKIIVEDKDNNVTTNIFTYYVKNGVIGEKPTVSVEPDSGTLEYGDKITVTAKDDDEIEYIEYYWDDDDGNTTKKYDDEFTLKVPSKEGKHYLYVRAMDNNDNLCDYERFTYDIKENKYPGNSDVIGEINANVRTLRVEIRNADDKIKFEPKEEILYYVDCYNGTSSKVTNAKVEVELPTYLEADKASDKGNITTKKVTWDIGTLDTKEHKRLTFTAQYTNDKYNEKIIEIPVKIYSGSSLKDTSTTRNMIFCKNASGTGNHQSYCVGYPDGRFLAEGKITRAEIASMIANIEGLTSSTYKGKFSDVNNHWAAKYIQAMLDKGYMKPSSYSSFGAQTNATRADLAYAIACILDVEDLEPIFISSSDVKYNDARCAMEQLLRLGIMDGYSDGTSKPSSNITRAEAVTIINNYLFRGELQPKGYNLKFTDLSSSHWAYGQIMEATSSHRYVRVMDGNEEML